MQIRVGVDVQVNSQKLGNAVMHNQTFWTFAATEWHRLYAPYVPMDTGMLTDTVSISPGEIEHTQPYARRMYYGENFHFHKTQHPKASAKWDKKAEATQKPKLLSTLQAYIDSGRIKLT